MSQPDFPDSTQRFDDDDEMEEQTGSTEPRLLSMVDGHADSGAPVIVPPAVPLMIGRQQSSDTRGAESLVIDSNLVSTQQAELRRTPSGGLSLLVLSEVSKTFVNDVKHEPHSTVPLYDGDLLRLGGGRKPADHSKLVYRVVAPGARRSTGGATPTAPITLDAGPESPAQTGTSAPRWVWQSSRRDDRWTLYKPEERAAIEAAYQAGERSVRISSEGATRIIDLSDPDNMCQKREGSTAGARPVRRDAKHEVDARPPSPSPRATGKRRRHTADHTSPGGASTARDVPNLDPAKRATVRVAVIRRRDGVVVECGSGAIVSKDGHVLTAAHVFFSYPPGRPPRKRELYGGLPPEQVLIAIGVYQSDTQPSLWKYEAKLTTPLEIIQERVPSGSKRLLDLAVLAITSNLALSPAEFQGTDQQYAIEREGSRITEPFRDSLFLGSSKKIYSGIPLYVLGWPSPVKDRLTIHADTSHELIAMDSDGLISTRAFIHMGSSGGPALVHDGRTRQGQLRVIGVASHNPKISDDTLTAPEHGGEEQYMAHLRSTERITLREARDKDPELQHKKRMPAVMTKDEHAHAAQAGSQTTDAQAAASAPAHAPVAPTTPQSGDAPTARASASPVPPP